ncbi:hypothetical protein [Methylovorus mays]|uniref:hypothetical protein n=1 Tax=Methylovorus mays TaxID=184077 RepID=UPI001E2B47FF|nr:hypothetical protein [Methylovorus mays]MCB5206229.1 hypothetical protein [Methylovorus mays]
MSSSLDTQQHNIPKDRLFNPYRLPSTDSAKSLVRDVLSQLMEYESHLGLRKRKRKAADQQSFEALVTSLVCDLVHIHLSAPERMIHISLSKRTQGRIKRYHAYSFSKTLPDVLQCMASPEMGFVHLEKGRRGHFGEGKQTTILPGPRLLSRIKAAEIELGDLSVDIHQETIILKQSKGAHWDKGEWVDYQDDRTTVEYRDHMLRINQWLADADLHCDLFDDSVIDVSDRLLRRIFNNGSFEQGGRLFGGFWQGMSKQQRKGNLFINGSPIVTLDFSQAGPMIAYSLAGATPPSDDAYAIPWYSTPKNRKSVKMVFNALLYSGKVPTRFPKGTRDGFDKKATFQTLMEKVAEVHQPIAHLFGTGVGFRIMFMESQILVKALLDCIDHGIVALPVHDALIVPKEKAEEVKGIMLESFKEVTGIDGMVELE